MDLQNEVWSGSILLVVRSNFHPDAPIIVVQENAFYGSTTVPISLPRQLIATRLDEESGYVFYRYNIEVKLAARFEKTLEYHVLQSGEFMPAVPNTEEARSRSLAELHKIHLPRAKQSLHWFFYSCSGTQRKKLDDDSPDDMTMWEDVRRVHETQPFNLMAGLGDQLYNDHVLMLPDVENWLKKVRRHGHTFQKVSQGELDNRKAEIMSDAFVTPELKRTFAQFYFQHYCESFTVPVVAKLMASIPQVMLWDDHDIFDGHGCFFPEVQLSPMIQAVYKASRRFYLLFQHHSTAERIQSRKDNPEMYNNTKSYSFLKTLDSQTALLGMDMRSERSVNQIISNEMWQKTITKLKTQLPSTCRQLLVISPVPIIWPSLHIAEASLSAIASIHRRFHLEKIFATNELYQTFMYPFGQAPELLDDLQDQWVSRVHIEERQMLINWFQNFSTERGIRVTFVSGDTHACGIGRFRSINSQQLRNTSPPGNYMANVDQALFDPRTMYCITSSAIINDPPPNSLKHLLHLSALLCSFINNTLSARSIAGIAESEFLCPELPADAEDMMIAIRNCVLAENYEPLSRYLLTSITGSSYLRLYLLPSLCSFLNINNKTLEEMLPVFKQDVDGTTSLGVMSDKIMNRRNWCRVQSHTMRIPMSSLAGTGTGIVEEPLRALEFTLHVEKERAGVSSDTMGSLSSTYSIMVPPLADMERVSTAMHQLDVLTSSSQTDVPVNGECLKFLSAWARFFLSS